MKTQEPSLRPWTIQDSEELYMIRSWGQGYFRVGANGSVHVKLRDRDAAGVDLHGLVGDLVERGLSPPFLLRFGDILEDRIRRVGDAFSHAIREYEYGGAYHGVFPIKVNQQRHVVEEVVEFGRGTGLGLEAGSKPELMVAIGLHNGPGSLVVCNGFKDREYMELAMLAAKLGGRTIVVADRLHEVGLCCQAAKHYEVRPAIGLRARLSTRGAGRWHDSTGERSKFGLSAYELLDAVHELERQEMLDCLCMLHFHIGSQITDIRAVKEALKEACRVYVELCALGAPMGWIDVGGGLGVDYDGSQTNFHSSMNYSLQEYANDVVAAVQSACDERGLPHPEIISESGRAITAHHAVLVTDVLGRTRMPTDERLSRAQAGPRVLQDLVEAVETVTRKNMIESYHDLRQLKDEAYTMFKLGLLDLEGRAVSECLFWSGCRRILHLMEGEDRIPEELEALPKVLSDIYYCNYSIFQSTPDHWAVRQLFPTMPIHRLDERPSHRAVLADLTCDSDGKMDRFIDVKDVADYLRLHAPNGVPYYVGIFLVGAYQEVLGDLHNLFGDTNVIHVRADDEGGLDVGKVVDGDTVREVLGYVQYDAEALVQGVRLASERALRRGEISKLDVQSLLRLYKDAMGRTTYLGG